MARSGLPMAAGLCIPLLAVAISISTRKFPMALEATNYSMDPIMQSLPMTGPLMAAIFLLKMKIPNPNTICGFFPPSAIRSQSRICKRTLMKPMGNFHRTENGSHTVQTKLVEPKFMSAHFQMPLRENGKFRQAGEISHPGAKTGKSFTIWRRTED